MSFSEGILEHHVEAAGQLARASETEVIVGSTRERSLRL
jgi:hypothetical protein